MIHLFDNVFPFKQRQYYYNFVKESNYRIGWPDSCTIETLNQLYFYSSYSEEDMEKALRKKLNLIGLVLL